MIGEKIIWFDEIDSTNDYALKNYERLHHGDVIVALSQKKGKGRKGRFWYSPGGGLWFSVVFKPRDYNDPNFFTKIASVTLVKLLKHYGLSPVIKWPNDILVNGKKLAGILTEGIFEGRKPLVIVVGIGVNLNNSIPDELKEIGVALKEVLGKDIPLQGFLKRYLKLLNSNYKKYSSFPGALTRVWKGYLDLKEGGEIYYKGKRCEIEKILQDRLILECSGQRIEVTDIVR